MTRRPARLGRPTLVRMSGILLRPFHPETWRELAFLLLGGLTAIAGFCVQVAGLSAGLSLLVTFVGIPILVALAYVDRWLCAAERWRVSVLLREEVTGLYRRPDRPGLLAWLRTVATDPQTWRDLGWIWLNVVLGFASAVLMLTLWASVLWLVSLPAYWWLLPESALPDAPWGGRVDTWAEVLGGAAVGLALTPVTAWVGAGLARGQARIGRSLLGPSERSQLRHRIGELTRTRAAAVDAQTIELRRIERDLHDGAQARMVAVTMDLGRAREKLDTDPEAARALVEAARAEATTAIADLRRLVGGIAPAVLTDRGLDAALSALVASSRIPVSLDVRLDDRVPAAVEGRRLLRRVGVARQRAEARGRAASDRAPSSSGREPDRRGRGRWARRCRPRARKRSRGSP